MLNIQKIPLAWKIVTSNKGRLALSLAGIAFSVVTMFLELGFFNGFNDSQVNLVTLFQAELVLMHKHKYNIMRGDTFHKAILYQTSVLEEIKEVIPIYEGTLRLRNEKKNMAYRIGALAFPVNTHPFKIPGLKKYQKALTKRNTMLYDSRSRAIYGEIREGMEIELSGRKYRVGGLIKLGPNFTRNGWVIMSDMNWLSISRRPNMLSFGLIQVRPGTDLEVLKRKISSLCPEYVDVMTPEEVIKRDTHFWTTATPFGIVFGTGLIIGFVIGIMICYQILFNEIADNMPQYATLKAVGFSNAYLVGVVMKIAILYSILGFFPGLFGGWILYKIIEYFTRINMFLTFGRVILIFILAVLMCGLSGLLALRKVIKADPAEVF